MWTQLLAKSLQIIRLARKLSICDVGALKVDSDTTKEEEQQHRKEHNKDF
jgi:hypothetical protein